MNLDSSTDEKFSRHLIFLPQKTVFKDNIHVGKCGFFLLHLEIKSEGFTLYSAISHFNIYFNGITCGNKYVFPAEVATYFCFTDTHYFSTHLLSFSIISICVCKNVNFLCLYVLFMKLLARLAFALKIVLQYDYDS